MKVMIDDVEYIPAEPALDLFGDGVKHACKMLVRYMERENVDLLDMGAVELTAIVRAEMKRDA
jgi:hypothetical protein